MEIGSPNGNGRLRRALDVVGGSLLLVLSSPLLALGATLVLMTSGRPVLFGHERVGLGGRRFRCWKLRTMKVDAEELLEDEPELKRRYVENGFKLPTNGDPRVTPVGRWLRRTYIDEIPQLFNVLGGSMSLIGPRPVVRGELVEFVPHVEALLGATPGVFGEWTSLGNDRPPYPERARVELEYVRNRSLWRDLGILARSVTVVVRGQREE